MKALNRKKGKKSAPKRKGSVYKPPAAEEPGDDGGDGPEVSEPIGLRRSRRKRLTNDSTGDGTGDGAEDMAGPLKNKQKK